MDPNPPTLFEPKIFTKVIVATFAALFIGWAIAAKFFGGLTLVDAVGSFISSIILAYLVHLWIVYATEPD